MAVNGSGSLVILVIVFFGALAFQAQVEGKPQDNFIRDREDNVSRIIDHTGIESLRPKQAKPDQFPWQILLEILKEEGGVNCGGSIIDQMWIMSAAHCFADNQDDKLGKADGYKITIQQVKIYAGITNRVNKQPNFRYWPGEIRTDGVDKNLFIHNDYNKKVELINDIALFKLKSPLLLDKFVYPILLATVEDFLPDVRLLIASGWGGMGFPDESECKFPFKYKQITYEECTAVDSPDRPWCSNETDPFGNYIEDHFKYCEDTTGCQFPFKYKENTYEHCTTTVDSPDRLWCSTETDTDGNSIEGKMKYCDAHTKETNKLRYVEGLQLKSQDRCDQLFDDFDKDTMICDETPRKGTFSGDSGGPVIFEVPKSDDDDDESDPIKVQIGIISWGNPRNGYAGVHTNVAKFRPWIHKQMGYSPEDSSNNDFSHDLCKAKYGQCIPDGGKCETTIKNLVNSVDDACVCCLPACSGSTRCHLPTPCPDDEDFFTVDGTKQCFKVLKQSATWEKANEDCKELNLTLAQPIAPVQLRSYIVQEYGFEEHLWLGACQDEPNKITWKRSGEEITIEDPLWYPGQPDFDEGCLLLLSNEEYLEEEPEKPFWNVLSTYEFYPLCEYLPDSIDNGECGSNSRVFLTRTGSKQCVPTSCPEDDDFFMPTGSKQCFKILKEKATWEQAVEECDEQGLDLAHPFDSVQLRSYIVQRYGRIEFLWLGASRNSETGMMIWERFGEEIPLKNPLWYKKHPKDGRLGCLLLLSNGRYWKKSPESPYWDSPCDIPQYPLCELVLP